MSINIHTNLYTDNALRQLKMHYRRVDTSMKRLSSGMRISSSADSPTGKAARENLRSEIISLQRGIRNAELAVSSLQNADSAIGDIDKNLFRMKELALQSANGFYSSEQQVMINSEFQSIASEIDRIAKDSEIGGKYLLDGSAENHVPGSWVIANDEFMTTNATSGEYTQANHLKIHIGNGNDREQDYYFVKLSDMGMDGLFGQYIDANDPEKDSSSKVLSIADDAGAMNALEQINTAIDYSTRGRANIGQAENRLSATIENLQNQKEMLQGTESLISDIDVAKEMAEFTSSQVMTNATVSVIGQANALPKMALKLLA